MAKVIPSLEGTDLTREDFTVVVSETTGKCTLVIPRIAVELSCEGYCDTLADWIFRDIDMGEGLGSC